MYFHHNQNQNSTSSAAGKHHDGPGPSGLGGWGRHTFTPSLPLPSPGGYPNGGGGAGFGPPPGHHGHPHHPSFGAGGLHMGSQGSGAMGMGPGQGGGFGMGIFGGGSPPRNGAESQVPMTPLWQQQIIKAESCRQNNAPHHRARSAAVSSRSANKAAITISDPNRPASSASNVNGAHKKNLSVVSALDRSSTPEVNSEASHALADPANATQAPVPIKEDPVWEQWSGLDLGGIRIKNLSTAMFSFTHLTSLYINHNTLTSIPPAISNLRQLTMLDATGNELTAIPPELGLLSKLKELLLFDNHLTTLPAEIGTLYKLEMLGIEGNPMEERYRKLLAEEGTEALIHHLRDTCAPGPGPPNRQFIQIEPDVSSPSEGPQESFNVLTYNILCELYSPQKSYEYTPKWALDAEYRRRTIIGEILDSGADVVCLQEIAISEYRDHFFSQLEANGYDGIHYAKSRARQMSASQADQVDGCATFWRKDKFSLVEQHGIDINMLANRNPNRRSADMLNRVAMRDNVGVVALLEFKQTGARLICVNSHIFWDHHYRDVKLVQIGLLLEEIERIAEQFSRYPPKPIEANEFNQGRPAPRYRQSAKGTDIPMVFCIDLNSLPSSSVYDLISKGEIRGDHEDFMTFKYDDFTDRGLKHRLGLRSAAESIGEMKMTNFTPTFTAAIDYIFYSPGSVKVTSVLGDVDKAYLDRNVGFPNAHFPSDHIPIMASFRVKGQESTSMQGSGSHGYTR